MALNSTNQPIRWKERIGLAFIGHMGKNVEETLFDYLLYPAVIAWLGVAYGGLVMTALSALLCYLYILAYDWSGKDWFGFELAKEARDSEEVEGGGRLWRAVQWATRKGDWAAFLALSMYSDPFFTTVYMRKGAGAYNGLSGRDWKVFWGSVIVANLWWTAAMTSVVEGIRAALFWLF